MFGDLSIAPATVNETNQAERFILPAFQAVIDFLLHNSGSIFQEANGDYIIQYQMDKQPKQRRTYTNAEALCIALKKYVSRDEVMDGLEEVQSFDSAQINQPRLRNDE